MVSFDDPPVLGIRVFQIARDHQRIQRLCSQRGLLFDEDRERVVCRLIHLVHLVVHRQHGLGHLRIALDKRL